MFAPLISHQHNKTTELITSEIKTPTNAFSYPIKHSLLFSYPIQLAPFFPRNYQPTQKNRGE
jgi:hypothetical protein